MQGWLIALRDVLAAECNAGGVEMIDAPVNACVGTDGQGQCLNEEVAAIGVGFIECTAPLKAVEHLSPPAITTQQITGFMGQQLWRPGHGTMSKAQAMEDHPGHGFTGCHHCVCIGHETGVDPVHEAQVFDDSGNHPSMLQAFDANRCHAGLLP